MDGETIREETPLTISLNRQKMELSELRGLIRELRSRLQSVLQEEPRKDEEINGNETEPVKLIDIIDRNSNQINKGYRDLRQIIKELTI